MPDTSTPIRMGIIGAGGMATWAHIPAYLRNPKCRVVAIADTDKTARDRAKAVFNISKVYESVDEMLESDILDGVSICTPPSSHAELVEECAQKGLHVLCEKPFALSVTQAESMVRAAQKNNIILAVGYTLRFFKNMALAKNLLSQGKLGELRSIASVYSVDPPKRSWAYDRKISGGGIIMDIGSHVIDLHNWLAESEAKEMTVYADTDNGANLEEEAQILLRYDNVNTLMSLSWKATKSARPRMAPALWIA